MADPVIGYIREARKALRHESVTAGERALANAMLAQAAAMYDVSSQLRAIIRVMGADRQVMAEAEEPLLRLVRLTGDEGHDDGP